LIWPNVIDSYLNLIPRWQCTNKNFSAFNQWGSWGVISYVWPFGRS